MVSFLTRTHVHDLAPRRVRASPPQVSPPRGQATRHYETLDALRGVAAVAVLLLHSREHFAPGLARSAYLAVDFFFVLSGFVVAHAYDARLGAGLGGGLTAGGFIKLRVVRLYPLHLAGLLIGAAAVAAGVGAHELPGGAIGLSLLFGALFLPSLVTDASRVLFPLNAPAWSLFFEMLANLAYGLTHRWLTLPVVVGGVALSAAALGVEAAVAGTIDAGATWENIHGGFARVAFGFGMGVLLHRCRDRIPPALGRLGPWPLLALMFALCLPTVAAPWRAAYDLAVVFVAAPLLVAAGSRAAPAAGSRPLFRVLGAISFPLYALHYPLEGWLIAAAEGLGLVPPFTGLAYVAAVLLVAWAVVPVDAAARRWLIARLGRRAPQTA